MIERYSRPRMKRVWSDENKFDRWLDVELAVCEAWTDEGVIPAEDMAKLRGARYDSARLYEILERTRHDMTAFLGSVTEGLGPEGRWLHLGLTTHDVWDTATNLQLMDASDLLAEEVDGLLEALKAKALEHKDTLMIGRTHGVHAEPITFGLKMARRGYVVFCPRCFLWSNDLAIPYMEHVARFRNRHPGSKGMAKMLFDATVALDVLAGLPQVDPSRLGAVGHSLGAKEVLYLAAFDERVKVTVSSEGGVGTRFSNWEAPWYLGETITQDSFLHEHHELLALIAPRPFLLVGGDSADGARSWPFIEAALPVYRLYGSVPRIGLFNHHKGHAVPPESEKRIDQWFDAYL